MNRIKISINLEFIVLLIGIWVYRLILDYVYLNVIIALYDYQNFSNNLTQQSYVISWLFLLLLSPLIAKTLVTLNLSSNILSLLALLSIIPTSTLIAFNGNYRFEYILFQFLYWLLVLAINLSLKPIKLKKNTSLKNLHILFTIVLSLMVFLVSWIFTGFRFHFGLMDVYDLRLDARGFKLPIIAGYLLGTADYILPIMLVYFLLKKKRLVSILLFVIIILDFGIAGSKHIIFLLALSIVGYFFINSHKTFKYLVWIIIFCLAFSIFEYYYFNTYFSTVFLSYRIMFIPSKLHYIYYDFFSVRELDYFRQSLLKWILPSPYNDNIGFLIGEYVSGITADNMTSGRANNGLFSDAYFNLGFVGIVFFPFILIIILKLLEGAVEGLSPKLLFSITISVFMSLLSLPLTVSLFSSGILLLIIFLHYLPRIDIRQSKVDI